MREGNEKRRTRERKKDRKNENPGLALSAVPDAVGADARKKVLATSRRMPLPVALSE